MSRKMRVIRSFLEIVLLADVKRSRNVVMEEKFSIREKAHLARAPLQTVAGFLAVKKAVAALAASVSGVGLDEREVVLSHAKSGAPRLVSIPKKLCADMPDKKNILVSISHSKTHAFGLAVFKLQRDQRAK